MFATIRSGCFRHQVYFTYPGQLTRALKKKNPAANHLSYPTFNAKRNHFLWSVTINSKRKPGVTGIICDISESQFCREKEMTTYKVRFQRCSRHPGWWNYLPMGRSSVFHSGSLKCKYMQVNCSKTSVLEQFTFLFHDLYNICKPMFYH